MTASSYEHVNIFWPTWTCGRICQTLVSCRPCTSSPARLWGRQGWLSRKTNEATRTPPDWKWDIIKSLFKLMMTPPTWLKTILPLETMASSVKRMMVTFLKVFNDDSEYDVLSGNVYFDDKEDFDEVVMTIVWLMFCKLWCPSWMSPPSCTGPSRSKRGRSWGWSPFWSPWAS